MKDQFIDVEVPIEQGELLDAMMKGEKDALAKEIINKHRVFADQRAAEVGGRLRLDHQPEWYIRRGSDLINGGDYILTASRWIVVVPNAFDMQHAAARSR